MCCAQEQPCILTKGWRRIAGLSGTFKMTEAMFSLFRTSFGSVIVTAQTNQFTPFLKAVPTVLLMLMRNIFADTCLLLVPHLPSILINALNVKINKKQLFSLNPPLKRCLHYYT